MNVIFLSVRTGSSRLPKKALFEIRGKTTIEYLIDRLKKSKYAQKIILCTTELEEDDVLCSIAEYNDIDYFRCSSPDKLSRWLGATQKYNVEFFVNVDGDDLFFDAGLADICFKQKRPKLVQANNRQVSDAIVNNTSLVEDSVKLYKGVQ